MARTDTPISELLPTRLIHPSERPPVPADKPHSKRLRFFYALLQLSGLFLGNAWLRLRGQKNAALCEKRTVKCLQRLGMLWIRVAQALTMRGSILSASFGQHLLDLRDRGGACGFQRIGRIIEAELGQPLDEVFDYFEEVPFSATTVSQLHRARLRREQTWTAVKVQQPLAEEIFARDLKLLRRFLGLLKFFSIQTGLRWNELYHELQEIKIRELNYYYEAAALETLAKNLQGQPVHVPRVFRPYCRQRVLVMEFIQGALLADFIDLRQTDPQRLEAWLKVNNIDPAKVARRLFHSTYRQVFDHNFFHGDMNTNNIILLRDSHIAVIECRSAGSLELESLGKQEMFLKSLSEGEYVTAAEIYFLLASRLPRVNLSTVKERLLRVWRVWETRTHIAALPYEQKSLAYMTGQVNQVVHDSQFAPLWSFTRLTCAWVHLDNALAALCPQMNYLSQLRRYFRRAEQRNNFAKLRRLPSRLASSLAVLHQVPDRTAEYRLFREALLRRQAQVVQGSASKVDAVIAAGLGFVSFLLMMVAGFLLLVFAMQQLQLSLETVLGPQLTWLASRVPAMGLGAWLVFLTAIIFLYGLSHNQKKRFSRQEFGRNGPAAAPGP